MKTAGYVPTDRRLLLGAAQVVVVDNEAKTLGLEVEGVVRAQGAREDAGRN